MKSKRRTHNFLVAGTGLAVLTFNGIFLSGCGPQREEPGSQLRQSTPADASTDAKPKD